MIKNKIKKMEIRKLRTMYRMHKILILLLVLVLFVACLYFIGHQNNFMAILMMIAYCTIPIVYILQFQQGVNLILTEELDIKRAIEANGILKPDTLVMPTLYYVYAHLVAGDWEETEQYLGRLKEKKLTRSNVKANAISYWHLGYFLNILQKKEVDVSQYSEQLASLNLKIAHDKLLAQNKLAFTQAMADIESGKANAYFETAEARHRLEQLIFDYYQGRNALLEGKEAEAREQFEKVAQTNKDDIYFVREAKNYLEEM